MNEDLISMLNRVDAMVDDYEDTDELCREAASVIQRLSIMLGISNRIPIRPQSLVVSREGACQNEN